MKKICIFEKVKGKLFAVRFEGNEKDELDKTFDLWRDVEELRKFFVDYRKDLGQFEPTLKVASAVRQAMEDAEEIYDRLVEFSRTDKLNKVFKPLDNREEFLRPYELQKLKAKGAVRKSMLRIYAVKYGDWYVITGSAIKLTDKMGGRPHLQTELKKLEIVKKQLQERGSEVSFVYMDI